VFICLVVSTTVNTDLSTLSLHDALPICSDQYSTDPQGGTFFLRMEFALAPDRREGLGERFGLKVAEPLGMTWRLWDAARPKRIRSEEHTSELQSRFDLVCRLLLEKNKEQ